MNNQCQLLWLWVSHLGLLSHKKGVGTNNFSYGTWELNKDKHARCRGWHIILRVSSQKIPALNIHVKLLLALPESVPITKMLNLRMSFRIPSWWRTKTLPKIFTKSLAIKSKHPTSDPRKHPEWSVFHISSPLNSKKTVCWGRCSTVSWCLVEPPNRHHDDNDKTQSGPQRLSMSMCQALWGALFFSTLWHWLGTPVL